MTTAWSFFLLQPTSLPRFCSKVPASLPTPSYKRNVFSAWYENACTSKVWSIFPIAMDFLNKVSPDLSPDLFWFDKRRELTLILKHWISELWPRWLYFHIDCSGYLPIKKFGLRNCLYWNTEFKSEDVFVIIRNHRHSYCYH